MADMKQGVKRAVLIAGPTASGKSGVAMALARRFDGVIVNADAMQVYRDLRLLTARPSPADEAALPHRLYGMVDGAEAWSVGRWLEVARTTLEAIWQAGGTPIVVGGTGLYFRALEQGLSPLPEIPDDVRDRWRERLRQDGPDALRAELARLVPDEVPPSDPQRLVRALEVFDATGEPLSRHHARSRGEAVLAGVSVARGALVPDRALLYRRCDERFAAMIDSGALDEVRRLAARGLDPDRPVMKAIGVASLMRYLEGRMTLDEAVAEAQKLTRNYAKRQMTWIRGQMADWPQAATPEHAMERLTDADT